MSAGPRKSLFQAGALLRMLKSGLGVNLYATSSAEPSEYKKCRGGELRL